MSILLAIDRSIPTASLALFQGKECIASSCCSLPPHGALLRSLVSEHFNISDIDCAVVGLGPGSFSGIRSALAFAKGLMLPSVSFPDFAKSVMNFSSVIGVPSCAAMAADYFRAHPEMTRVFIVGDARRDTLWMAEYARNFKNYAAADIRALPKEEVLEILRNHSEVSVVSPDFGRLKDVIAGLIPYPFDKAEPLAVSIGKLALSAPDSAMIPPLPIYLHPAVRQMSKTV